MIEELKERRDRRVVNKEVPDDVTSQRDIERKADLAAFYERQERLERERVPRGRDEDDWTWPEQEDPGPAW